MNLNLRIFLTFSLALSLAIMVAMYQFITEIKPGVRLSAEHTLIDTAQLLAQVIALEDDFFEPQSPSYIQFSQAIDQFLKRKYSIDIYNIEKSYSDLRIYIVNDQGIVLYDSRGEAVGHDYSRWNDVYLTLRGEYGARTTQEEPDNPLATTMYVAAPIVREGKMMGVLTVGKPNILSQPFIDLAQNKLKKNTIMLGLIFILIGGLLSFWLTQSIRKLAHYANGIAKGQRASLPNIKERELKALGNAMELMRKEVEGKAYIEKYVHALTHEIKSPVTAIQAAAEIINPEMPVADQQRFLQNIHTEITRLNDLINRLLKLASIEKQNALLHKETCLFNQLIQERVENKSGYLLSHAVSVQLELEPNTVILADTLLIGQAVDNLLINAIEFSPKGGVIKVRLCKDSEKAFLSIEDQGPGIPAFAKARVFERFYSLPRPSSGKKSTGLGLCFVKEIIELHQGSIALDQPNQGLKVSVALPLALAKKNSAHTKNT